MRLKVAATAALVLAIAASSASAGVVISEDVVATDNAGKQHKSEQTIVIQGGKQKVITSDRVIISDPAAGKMFVLAPALKRTAEVTIPPSRQVGMVLGRLGIFVSYQKSSGVGKVAGYDCQNYAGTYDIGRVKLDATQCVASAAAGAAEYVAYCKAFADKLKGSPQEIRGEIPDGIPVSTTLSTSFIPFPIPANYPADQAAKIRESRAKAKPQVTTIKVTKIVVNDLPADTFAVPADYQKPAAPNPGANALGAAKPSAAASPSH